MQEKDDADGLNSPAGGPVGGMPVSGGGGGGGCVFGGGVPEEK